MNCKTFFKKLRLPALVLAALALAAAPSFAIDLVAIEGTWLPPGGTAGNDEITMWGFAEDSGQPCDSLPAWTVGPEISAVAGETLTINLRNCLGEPVSFFVPGLRADGAPPAGMFTVEAASNGTASYTYSNIKAGTFLYHSATNRIRTQVPMGLYGALVVDQAAATGTTPAQAYPGVAYDQDEVLVFSEIDPNLNADPAGFGGARVINWNPQYFLINGQAWPNTANLAYGAGENVLLRLVNACLETLVPTLEGGLYMDLVAEDGNPYPHPMKQYGVELTAGKAVDAMLTVTNEGTYPLFDRGLHLTNGPAAGGGMLTYLEVAPGAGIFQLGSATYSVDENVAGGILTVTVSRVGGSDGAVTVAYASADGTATAGIDYTAASDTLNFADTQTSATFDIMIVDDPTYEGDETFTVSLSDPTGGAILGTPSNATVTIADDEEGFGALQLSAAAYSVDENGGTLTITVNRVGGSDGAVTVAYATANGTATAWSDYETATGTLEFAATQTSATFDITILDDLAVPIYEGDETFTVSLSDPTGGATLGTPSSAAITILDNEQAPNVAPVANDDFAETPRNTTITFNVVNNDDDPDCGTGPPCIDRRSVVITTGTITQRGGTVSADLFGNVTYIPKKNFLGTDTFQYTVEDDPNQISGDHDGLTSNAATVRVNVVR